MKYGIQMAAPRKESEEAPGAGKRAASSSRSQPGVLLSLRERRLILPCQEWFMSTLTQMPTHEALEELLSQRILLLDGSMGALIYSRQPSEEDYRGTRFRNHPKLLK